MQLMRKQAGMTLVSVLISAAIGSFVVLAIATGVSQVYQAQRSANLGFTAGNAISALRLTVEMPQACDAAFDNFTFNPSAETSLSGIQFDSGGYVMTLTENQEIEPGLLLKKIALVPNSQVPPKVVRVNNVDYNKYLAYVAIETEKTGANLGKSSPPTYIPLSVVVNLGGGAQPIRNCGATAVSQEVCTASQGIWDPTRPLGQQCRPAGGCKYGGSFGEAPLDRGGYVNEFTNAMSCPNGYSKQRSGSITYTTQCGKKCVKNTYYPTYECIVCKNADGTDMALLDAVGSITEDDPIGYDDAEETATENTFNGQYSTINQLSTTTNTTVEPIPEEQPTRPACTAANDGSTWNCYYCFCYNGSCNWVYNCEIEPTCFAAGSQIRMGDGSSKAIEDVKTGDEILAFDDVAMQPYVTTIRQPIHHKPTMQKLLHVTLADGRKFTTNDLHPIYVVEQNDWVRMKQIFALHAMGLPQSLLSSDGSAVAIEHIDVTFEVVPMYNLEVVGIDRISKEHGVFGRGHTYFVEDILVHNILADQQIKTDTR